MEGHNKTIAKELSEKFSSQDFETQYEYKGNDLGAVLSENGTTFKVWSPIATAISVNLYPSGEPDAAAFASYEMIKGEKGVWHYEADKRLDNVYYTYTVTALGEKQETGDIYARACGVNGHRSMVVDLDQTHPEGWEKDQFVYDADKQPIIYELHIKDFSNDEKSGIEQAHRGKYLAFTHKTSCYEGDITKPTCLAYLKSLGITHVHLLPMYDFGSIDETRGAKESFNWGYDPINYNVPEGSYATDAHEGSVRIREMKAMIKALHEEGIGVIMDVVYNHTYSTDSYFQRTVPYYYYRLDEAGNFANGSGCGNETASERTMFRKYMIDSIMYWAQEYHLDGFRFDLMGVHDVETMNEIRKQLDTLPHGKSILMYGEPWAAEPPAMAAGAEPADKAHLAALDTRIAIFSDDTRDAIKGSVFLEKDGGYINGKPELSKEIPFAVGAWCQSEAVQATQPGQILSYLSAHDNFTLYDKLVLSLKETADYSETDPELLQINKLGAAIAATCFGGSFMQAGEEFARTKQGIGDSYNAPATINQLDWEWAYAHEDLIQFYKGLIKFRKTVPALMCKTAQVGEHLTFIGQEAPHVISFTIHDRVADTVFVAYNPSDKEVAIRLATGNWQLICDGHHFLEEERIISEEMTMPCKSAVLLRARK